MLVLILVLLFGPQTQSADEKLDLGARLVERDCGDCAGRSVSELDRGVALVEEALREGAKDRRKGLLALTYAYSEYAFAYDKARPMSDATRESWRKRLVEVYKERLRDDPKDASLWLDYADVVVDGREQLGVYQHALELQPDFAEAAFRAACIHVSLGQNAEAVREFERAARMSSATAERIEWYAQRLKQDLGAHGHERENAKYIEQVSAAARRRP